MRTRIFSEPPEEPADYRNWRRWFAWFPVFIGDELVWLEFVERRHSGFYPPTLTCPHDYRLPVSSMPSGDRGAEP